MAGTVSIALGLKGPMLTLNAPGVAGEMAVARAIALLEAKRAPAVVVCGIDELCPMLYEGLALLGVSSPRNGGEECCRPFDQRQNGPILGEGATALVLETLEHAQMRGAPIVAEIYSACWGGISTRPHQYPSPSQLHHRLLGQTLKAAALSAEDVDAAYLSGSGDPQRDTAELALLAGTFDLAGPWLTSLTHLTGDYGSLGTLRMAAP